MLSQCSLIFFSLLSEAGHFFLCLGVIFYPFLRVVCSCVLPVTLEDFDDPTV